MKKVLSIIASLALVAVIATSCSIAQSLAGLGSSNGITAGNVLTSLLSQSQNTGKLDTSDLNTMINLATLASSIQGLKGNVNNSNVFTDFAQGLVLGSNNKISKANSSTITTILAGLANNVDLSSLASVLTRSAEVTKEEAKALAATPEAAATASIADSVFKLMNTK